MICRAGWRRMPSLEEILEAHGGLETWRRFSKIQADVFTGGGLFPIKGLMPDLTRRMTVWLKEERASVMPFGAPDQRHRIHSRSPRDREAGWNGDRRLAISKGRLH